MSKVCKQCNSPYEKGNAHFGLCRHCNNIRLVSISTKKKQTISRYTPTVVKLYVNTLTPVTTVDPKVEYVSKERHKHINTYGVKDLKTFFSLIWEEREHICNHCYKRLGNEPKAHYFSHIFPKSLKPWLKFDANNIELLCIDCHTVHDFGKRKNKLR